MSGVETRQIIYKVAVGSRLHGIRVGDQCDDDEMAVFVPYPEQIAGFHTVDTIVHRPGRGPQDPSGPGDLDLTIYDLRKYLRLFLKGNPSVVQTAFVPVDLIYEMSDMAIEMRALLRECGISQRFLKATHGYMKAQIAGFEGSAGTKVKRPELVARHGYDTKYAFHALRLGLQAIEFAETGKLVLPLTDQRYPYPEWTKRMTAVRIGEVGPAVAAYWLERVLEDLEGVTHSDEVPAEPDEARVEDWYMNALRESWAGLRSW